MTPSVLGGDFIDAYDSYLSHVETTAEGRRWAAIAALSGATVGRCWFDFMPRLDPLRTNLYVLLVGDSGTGKGTSSELAKRLLKALEYVPFAADVSTGRACIDYLQQNLKTLPGYHINGRDVVFNPGVLWTSEISATFQRMTNDQAYSDLLIKSFDGGEDKQSTKHHGENEAVAMYMTIFGGIQPRVIQSDLKSVAVAKGFPSRCIFVWMPRARVVLRPDLAPPASPGFEMALLQHLETVHRKWVGPVHLSNDFWNAQADWTANHERGIELRNSLQNVDTNFDAFHFRKRVIVAKLSVIAAMSEEGAQPCFVDGKHWRRAASWMDDVQAKMSNVFYGMGRPTEAAAEETLKRLFVFLSNTKGSMTLDEIYNVVIDTGVSREWVDETLKRYSEMGRVDIHMGGFVKYFTPAMKIVEAEA